MVLTLDQENKTLKKDNKKLKSSLKKNKSTNQNKELLKYGFKLYDNVLDYSFDDEEDVFKRYDLIIEQLIKLKNKDYNKLYDLMEPTLEYNKQLIHKITHGSNHIPNEILNIYENRN